MSHYRNLFATWFGVLTSLVVVLSSCGATSRLAAPGVTAPDGFDMTLYARDFQGPTQMVLAPNGDLIVAELNGAENDATGRIVRVAAEDPDRRTVLQTGLDKPTGVAVVGDHLWIMERRRLSITTLTPDALREVVVDDMPFNGRSQGTLTLTPNGRLLYDTSGSKRGADRITGSGTIFAIENAAAGPSEPIVVATGFKHGYAQVVDADDQLWTVEMTDGNFDDQRAPDELVPITLGDDGGWPQCVGNNRPVAEYGGTDALCAESPESHAIFGVGATPTSLVVSPWDDGTFIVALWLPGQVVTVPRSRPTNGPHQSTLFIEGIESPQHLLVLGDELLISDHETGQIFSVAIAES